MHVLVLRRKLAPAFFSFLQSVQIKYEVMTQQLQKLPVKLPVSHAHDVFMSQCITFYSTGKNNNQNPQFAMETICVAQQHHMSRRRGKKM